MHLDTTQANAIIGAFFPRVVGIEFTHLEPGHSVCRLSVTPQLHNPGGVVHGGVHYSMADTGMAFALMRDLDDGQRCTTIEIKVAYYRAVTEGELTCSTRVVSRGRRIAFLQSRITNGDTLVAEATGTYYVSEIGK